MAAGDGAAHEAGVIYLRTYYSQGSLGGARFSATGQALPKKIPKRSPKQVKTLR